MSEHPFSLSFRHDRSNGVLTDELRHTAATMGPGSTRSAALMVQLFGVQLGLALERAVRPEEAVRYLRNASDYLKKLEGLGYEVRLVKSGEGEQAEHFHNRN